MVKLLFSFLLAVAIMTQQLYLTDGTTLVELRDRHGFMLREWVAAPQEPRDTWHDPGRGERRVAATALGNAREEMELDVRGGQVAAKVARLQRLMEQARRYWAGDPTADVVWLANETCEQERFAAVKGGDLERLPAWHNSPYGDRGEAAALRLTVERGPWLETKPGTATCVQSSGEQEWAAVQTTVTASPAASGDDGWAYNDGSSWTIAGAVVPLGNYLTDPALAGIRFMNLNVPQGAQIVNAYVTFTAVTSLSNKVASVRIWGEDVDSATIFSTWGDFAARLLFSAGGTSVLWPNIEPWTAANTYNTPDLTPIIQEIVNRSGWAANNELALFFVDSNSDSTVYRDGASWDHPTAAAPQLTVTYATSSDVGREETCDDEVYIANKHNRAQITHIYHYDADATDWSENLIGTVPSTLLPDTVENGDIIYFGILSSLVDSGPFSNLVFDISTASVYGGAATMTWQYWNGAWTALTVQENTGPPTQPFSYTGVNSVHWKQPTDWVANAAAPAAAVTAYWVRALVTIGGGDSIAPPPTQQNRAIYTVDWPCVEVAADQVPGDIPALARIKLFNVSKGLVDTDLESQRVIVATRSMSRGSSFTPYINLADEQNDPGLTVSAGYDSTFAAATNAPTGRAVYFNSTGAGTSITMTTRVRVGFTDDIDYQYFGRFWAFVRGWQVTGGTVGNVGVRLALVTGGDLLYTQTKYFTALNDFQLLDMGLIKFPAGPYPDTESMHGLTWISVQAQSVAAADDAYFTDLILMPVDEWCGEFVHAAVAGQPSNESDYYLDVDSITYPFVTVRASLRQDSSGQVSGTWEPRARGPAVLAANAQQRIWALATTGTGSSERCRPEVAHSVQVWRQARYKS